MKRMITALLLASLATLATAQVQKATDKTFACPADAPLKYYLAFNVAHTTGNTWSWNYRFLCTRARLDTQEGMQLAIDKVTEDEQVLRKTGVFVTIVNFHLLAK